MGIFGQIMEWFCDKAGSVVLMCENLKTYGFIDENLVIVYSDQWKRNKTKENLMTELIFGAGLVMLMLLLLNITCIEAD